MKKLLVILIGIVTLVSCVAEKTIQKADGTWITEKEFKRLVIKAHRAAMREMSKEERKVIKTSFITIETEGNN